MRISLYLTCLWLFFSEVSFAQIFTNSNLPIFVINTDNGASIVDDPRVRATMKIIYRGPGQRNYLTDQNNPAYLNYNGRIDIEIRGSSSQVTDKKQYGFSTKKADDVTNNNVKLLGMPGEHDWILNSMTFDPALIRDYLSYNLSRQIGSYASRTAYCEVIINGIHKGLYLLQEKIKADDNRVDVMQIGETDNSEPAVSGGYITKADKNTGGDPTAWTMSSINGGIVSYIHDWPKPENVTRQQTNYISSRFLALGYVDNNSSVTTGYPSVIDVPSFVNFMLVSELGSNADAYQFSTYFHKDRNGKLRAGPVWDNDLTYGNDLFFWGLDRSHPDVWQFSNGDNEGSIFWFNLFHNAPFHCYLARRWNELTEPGQPFHQATLEAFIDQTVAEISEAVARDYYLWGTVGDHQQHISNLKSWLNSRYTFLNSNLASFSSCQDITVPPLVISKIMYHPDTTSALRGEDLEFIEITNHSDQPTSLAGVYFSGTGLVYQFPNAILSPHATFMVASNSAVFQSFYGCTATGQYTRHLSNKGQGIVLADGFGNVIDLVQYNDSIPWPDADGNGLYLKLTDPGLDNNDAANWTASNDILVSNNNVPPAMVLQIYPNPVKDRLFIEAGTEILWLSVMDMQGRILVSMPVHNEILNLDMGTFQSGPYMIRVVTAEETYTGKIIKE